MSPAETAPEPERERCPLCRTHESGLFHEDKRRLYFRCQVCSLIWVPSRQFLSPRQEKAEYDLHQNHPGDMGYRRFLGRLFDPMVNELPAASRGLDFGSGPGPTLSVMFEEAGHSMALYDPFYAPDRRVLDATYDFVTATEVVEHLHRPMDELDRLWRCVRPGGLLGLMTKLALGREAFARWHYKNDLTHVCFFSHDTFRWLGDRFGSAPRFIGQDVILFRKSAEPPIG